MLTNTRANLTRNAFPGMVGVSVFGGISLFSSPLLVQQRVVVEKGTGNVVDAGDASPQYDSRYFDQNSSIGISNLEGDETC